MVSLFVLKVKFGALQIHPWLYVMFVFICVFVCVLKREREKERERN